MPCFEIWFLLHYIIPKQSYKNQDKLIEELEKHFANYSKRKKEQENYYTYLKQFQKQALSNNKELRDRTKNNISPDISSCSIDLLITEILAEKLKIL